MKKTISLSEEEWKKKLSDDEYRILRKKGTERAFTGNYWDHKEKGTYHCAGCGNPLFHSKDKYDSGTGWPSFTKAIEDSVDCKADRTLFGKYAEALCSCCASHLGHVFDDGPPPTGKRYCMNSLALEFKGSP